MASIDATLDTILLVVGIFALTVIGHVTYALQFGDAFY